MKISAFLLFCCLVNIFAAPTYSQSTKISLNLKDATIEDVLNKIEDVSEFYFLYNNKLIDVTRKVNIEADKEPIKDILNDILKKDTKFIVYDRQIILTASDVTSLSEALQQRPVTGTITDATTGEPMPGVNVLVKGTTIGALSDVNGKYTLIVSDPKAVLSFSFVGYVTQEIAVGGNLVINVALSEDILGLEEVVVIGYGTTKKVTLTGAVSSVGGEELKSISSDNLVTHLQGKLPGFRITQRSGQPGGFTTVYDIRGLGTPLIVVNGIVTTGDDFVRLNPEDIDQISILKDASAAVYGVKAANGVVLVTTKRGAIGKPSITYTGSATFSTYVAYPRESNAYQYAWALTQSEINQGADPSSTTFSPEDLQSYKDGTNPFTTNWFDEVVGNYAPAYKHNLSISGGSDRITYLTSIGTMHEVGIWKSRDLTYTRYNLRSTVSSKITNNLVVDVNLEGMFDFNKSPSQDDQIGESIWVGCLPTRPIYANNNPDYFSTQATFGHNAIAEAEIDVCGYTKARTKTVQGTISLKYTVPFIDGLDAQLMFGYYNMDKYEKKWFKEWSTYDYDVATDTYIKMGSINSPSTLYGTYNPLNRTTLLGQLNYNKVLLEKHSLKASLIFEERHELNDNLQASKQFAIDIDQFYAGVANPIVTSASISENDNQSVIGRINYDYLAKYLLEVGFNYNGSSKFPAGHRWGFFPYASAGWRISEEPFFKSNLPFITNLKFRGSYGLMGDDAASKFQFLSGYNYPSSKYIINGIIVNTLGFRGIPNPNITWYTITSKNIGIDLSLGEGLINLSFDVFRRNRSGLLATRILTIPGTVGATLSQENLNKDMRKGFELVLGHSRTVRANLHYDISASFSYSSGQKTYVERSTDGNSYLNWKNNTTDRWDNIVWGYEYIGQFQSQEEINTSPLQDTQGNRTLQPGDYKYKDVNKDGIVNTEDQLPIFRSNIPEINSSLSSSINYKSFDFSILIQGAANFTQIIEGSFSAALPWNRGFLARYTDCWHHEDIYDVTSPWIPGKYASPKTRGAVASNGWRSSIIAVNANYIRLKSMEIGYTLKQSWARKLYLENLRIYVSGFNLLTLSKMKDWDPETSQSRLYPIMRDITFGINAKF